MYHQNLGVLIEEAIERIKKTHTGNWGESLKLEGDFGDLYSNCNKELLEKCLKHSCQLAKLSTESIEYILNLMSVSMNHSYFKEPKGIYKTDFRWETTLREAAK